MDATPIGSSVIPAAIAPFVTELAAITRRWLGEDLVGLWVVGSIATGDAVGPDSDVDVLVACAAPLGDSRRAALAEAVVEAGQRCPWAGVEYVVYRSHVLAAPTYPLDYELNVNSGPTRKVLVSSGGDPAHWFLLDVAMARDAAVPVVGPAAADVIGPPRHADVASALLDSLRWHEQNETATASSILNACRALCWLETGRWRSKSAAGAWALERTGARPRVPDDAAAAVAAALTARRSGTTATSDQAGARALTAVVRQRARSALRSAEREPADGGAPGGEPGHGRM